MTKIQYGSIETTRIIDQEQSTMSTEVKIHQGQRMSPVRNRFKIRHLTNSLTIEELGNMVKSLLEDPTKLESCVYLETDQKPGMSPRYYIVEAYTVIE